MRRKLYSLLAATLCSLPALAQWTQPAAPARQEALPTSEAAYLYNVEADAFYLGANDWNTRASVSATHGYKVSLEAYTKTASDTWDGSSYKIMTAIEAGSPAGQTRATFITSYDNIWVDAADDNTSDKAWTFNQQADGTYRIGVSALNSEFTPSLGYETAYLGLIPEKADTRVYLCEEGTGQYDYAGCQMSWYFVSEANYTAYIAAKEQYEAALLLGADIEAAKAAHPTADLSAAEAVYADLTSTVEQLTAARTLVAQAIAAVATTDNPADVTYSYVTNPSYADNDNTGWSGTTPGFQSYGNAEFYQIVFDHNQTLSVPVGVYRVSVNGYYRAGSAEQDAAALTALQNGEAAAQNAKLYATSTALPQRTAALPFASTGATAEALGSNTSYNSFGYIPNDMKTAAAYMAAGKYAATSLLTMAGDDGSLTIGLKNDTFLSSGWALFDDWKLEYLGNDDAAYNYLKADYLSTATDYQAAVENNTLEYYGHADYQTLVSARAALDAATTAATVPAALSAYMQAVDTFALNVDAYAAYYAKYVEAQNFLDERGESLMGEGMDVLADYLDSEDAPSDAQPLYPNGGALYILHEGSLGTADVTAETSFLQQLMDNAVASGMSDGTDCTDLIKNAHFAEEGVWTKTGLPEWPVGTDDYKLAQGYSILFDVNQTITGLQNGLYELTLNDFFRPANFSSSEYSTENYRAYVYMNDDEAKLNLIESGATDTISASGDVLFNDTQYVPNNVEAAAIAFQQGRYKQSLYGIVTDGTLKIGVRNDLRYEGCWAAFSDFHLVFRAKNADVLADVTASTIAQAQALLSNKCGQADLAALQTAIETAQGTPDDAYQALVDLKAAMAQVDSCTQIYAQLQEAISNGEQTLTDYADASADLIATLQSAVDAAKAGYESGSFDMTAAAEQTSAVSAAVVAVKMGGDTTEEKDVSSLIVNNTFDPARGSKDTGTIEGWTTSAMNGYKEYTVSYNRAGIDLSQTLVGLPAGHYRMTVHTYYRAGYADEDYALFQQDPEASHLTTLYANVAGGESYSTKVMNLCEDAQSEAVGGSKCDQLSNGLYVPNGTSATVTWFNAGYYLNTLEFDVTEDGTDVTIGLSKTEVLSNDYEVVGAWNLYYTPAPQEQDVSSLIVNNTFDPSRGSKDTGTIEGWTTSAMNGYKEYTVSYNRAGIDLSQTLVGLPAGHYRMTVHTYYRAGYADEDYALFQQDPEASHLTTLYANVAGGENYSTKVMNLCEGAQSEAVGGSKCDQLSNGLYVPNGTSATVTWFNAGYYLNTLEFDVTEDGTDVTIGLLKTEVISNDYEVVGEWNLYYTPTDTTTAIEVPAADGSSLSGATPAAYYSLSGARLSAPQHGINIVKMSDGTSRKIFVK